MEKIKYFFLGLCSYVKYFFHSFPTTKEDWRKQLILPPKDKLILILEVSLILCLIPVWAVCGKNTHVEVITYVSLGLLVILLYFQSRIKFYPIWLIVAGLGVATLLSFNGQWGLGQVTAWISLGYFILFMLRKPLNLVYGLIGTKGSIRTYVTMMIVINTIFSGIYHYAIFKDAGITYDINQPHISYGMFHAKDTQVDSVIMRDIIYTYNLSGEKISYIVNEEKHHYQKIEFPFVLKNTVMTSLMQEPSDFFAIASTYNESVDDFPDTKQINKEKSELFHWLLILQVFISWIFFGVFISILYNKFRYES